MTTWKKEKVIAQMAKIIEFMDVYHVFFNPVHSLLERSEVIVKLGHCICKKERLYCPCEEALEEIKTNNKCFCGLLYTKEGILNYYNDNYWEGKKTVKEQSQH